MSNPEYDPELGLWKPSRRTFLFLSGSAMAGTLVSGWYPFPKGIAADFTISCNKTISYIGRGDNHYSVLALHRWLQGMADQQQAKPGEIDIVSANPSIRRDDKRIEITDDYAMSEGALDHLNEGTIKYMREGQKAWAANFHATKVRLT